MMDQLRYTQYGAALKSGVLRSACLAQEADVLLLGQPLLHVQSPSDGGLDSEPLRGSTPAERRSHGNRLARHPPSRYPDS
jgi:hypothetical protein